MKTSSRQEDDRLLNRREVDEAFGIPRRFLEKSAATCDGPPRVYIGRLVRYRVRDIRQWIDANVQGGSR